MNYVADFETTTQESYIKEGCVRVWAWACVEMGYEDVKIGKDIDSFMNYVMWDLDNPKIYFHNVKFDMGYILSWLLNNGYVYDDKKADRTFNAIISDSGIAYQVEVIIKRYSKKFKKVTFVDSYKKLPFTVERIAKAFGLKMLKGNIDYHKYRPIGYEMDDNEISYIKNDVLIVSKALEIQNDQGLTKMTIGSDALNSFKTMYGKKDFKYHFPILDLETDALIRESYKGGWTYSAPRFRRKTLGGGKVYDVNSLYPWAMRYNLLPHGKPVEFQGKYENDPVHPLYIQTIRCAFKIKPDHLPTIQIKNGWMFGTGTEYVLESDEEETLVLTSIDLQLFLEHYDVFDLEYMGGFKFMGSYGIFDEYIDHWNGIKETSKGATKELAKLMLNNLYGKFGTNPDVTGKYAYLDDYGVVKFESKGQEFRDPVFIPMASFITAYAREKTIRTAQENYDRFFYADTDSIHLLGFDEPNIEVHPTKLGYWKHEYDFRKGKAIRSKMYMEETIVRTVKKDNPKLKSYGYEWLVKGAGIPEDVRASVHFDDYDIGYTYPMLKPIQVKGGTLLITEMREVKAV